MTDENELIKSGMEAIVKPFSGLIEKLFGPAAEEFGLTLRDGVRVFRIRRQLRLLTRVDEMLKSAGHEPRHVPLKFLYPVVENASFEEDDDLQDKWAALLANAALTNEGTPIAFVDTLRQLTMADVQLLRRAFYEVLPIAQQQRYGIPQHRLRPVIDNHWWPEVAASLKGDLTDPYVFRICERSLETVVRLGLLITTGGNAKVQNDYEMMAFGFDFVRACEEPATLKSACNQINEHRFNAQNFLDVKC